MATFVEVNHLTKRYGQVVAVNDLTLELCPGEILGLLGPNGAGKSTTLGMLCGLVHPNSGSVSFFGKDLRKHYPDVMARVGVLVERPAFYDFLTARQNLKLSARMARKHVTVERVLEFTGLTREAGKRVGQFSHGMRQRLGLAQALVTEPDVLLLDEPTNGLDPESSCDILRLLRVLSREAKVSVLISSHLLGEVEELCDRVAILNQGRLVACEETDALLTYDQTDVEVLLDSSEAALKRLHEQDWVLSAEGRGTRIHVRLREPNVNQLVGFLAMIGCRISGVIPRRRTLRDFFLEKVGSK